MGKKVLPPFPGDESETLLIVEPLDLTGGHDSHSFRETWKEATTDCPRPLPTRQPLAGPTRVSGHVTSTRDLGAFPRVWNCGTYDSATRPFPCGIHPLVPPRARCNDLQV